MNPSSGIIYPQDGYLNASSGIINTAWISESIKWNFKPQGWISESLQWNYKPPEWISESVQWNYKPQDVYLNPSSGM